MSSLAFIFATGEYGEFGHPKTPNHLPFRNKDDLNYFKTITTNAVLIAGYHTGSVLPRLSHRHLLIIDRKASIFNDRTDTSDIIHVPSVQFAIKKAEQLIQQIPTLQKNIYIIGGSKLFNQIRDNDNLFPRVNYVYHNLISQRCIKRWITRHNQSVTDVTYLNYRLITNHFTKIEDIPISKELLITSYYRNGQEMVYLNLLKEIINFGEYTINRTATPTLTLLNKSITFDISNNKFPLFTHRKMFLKGIFEELKWFLSGQTDSNILQKKKVKIWKKNSTKKFLEEQKLTHYEQGDCGPIYGFQWKHFGAEYKDCKTDYSGRGFDQIGYVIQQLKDSIKNKKASRRIVLSGWNPPDLKKMALPPCHILYIWNLHQNKLSGTLVMRSGDLVLGVPFNVASLTILTRLIAKEVGLECGKVTVFIANAHIYENHLLKMKPLLAKNPIPTHPFPTLELDKEMSILHPEKMSYKQLKLKEYKYHPRIKLDMVA